MRYSILEVLKDIKARKLVMATEGCRVTRINICLSCGDFNPTLRLCAICYCNVDGKTRLEKASCPKGKW